ncbi:helix-turn-helix transcriptional regulator [Amphritea sp. 2_MG-2023]|uniref:helix-turn-helix domain-containing protein n=2 Tax=Oceanospirillaceae TaxID=135620 RepID=UPI001C06E7DF|nr:MULTISPECIES: helix-turn-helix transcriptional regulator [Amphritea]MBU2965236.1 helix-turn-helix domain-containing protein [Amphritea atlantica]MDO6420729.1 helix-turn-helix transcriptional regulator [Amphritea sp. 2_MG-2023]
MNIIGPNVRKLREHQHLTQDELAAKCNICGWDISRGTLAKIESKVRKVSDYEALTLAQALNVNIDQLFYDLSRIADQQR